MNILKKLLVPLFLISAGYTYDGEAVEAYNFLQSQCKQLYPTSTNYWDRYGDGFGTHENGWMGTHAIQSSFLLYELTCDDKYLGDALDFAFWLRLEFSLRNSLTTCETVSPATTVNNWADDAGWMSATFLQYYTYTSNPVYVDLAYEIVVNSDNRWGENYPITSTVSRGMRYYDNDNRLSLYITSNLISALELYNIYKMSNMTRAMECLELACKYYNFVENELKSDGTNSFVLDGVQIPANIYVHQRRLNTGNPEDNGNDECYGFTYGQMSMAVIHKMLLDLSQNTTERNRIRTWLSNNTVNNLSNMVTTIANTMIMLHSNGGLAEASNSSNVTGSVLINARDANTNSFALYWWIKHIVPLNTQYGDIIKNTASVIINNHLSSMPIDACWNSSTNGTGDYCSGSQTKNVTNDYFRMVKHATGTNFIAAAALIDNKQSLKDQIYWKNKLANQTHQRIMMISD